MLERSINETLLQQVCEQSEHLEEIWSDMDASVEHYETSVNNLRTWLFSTTAQVISISKCISFLTILG